MASDDLALEEFSSLSGLPPLDDSGEKSAADLATVFDVPGHTRGHIAYWFAGSDALFCGDTLFALGCGRLFEGTPEQMWQSLSKFRTLPDSAHVYCAHEYTLANARFALTVEPQNAALRARAAEVDAKRARGEPTVPSTIGLEKATNPLLRPMSEVAGALSIQVGAWCLQKPNGGAGIMMSPAMLMTWLTESAMTPITM